MRRVGGRLAMLVLAVAGCAGLGGCTAPALQPVEVMTNGASSTSSPSFSGPFAAEYGDAWKKSANEFVHGVLEDEEISDREWAEVSERMTVCFANKQVDFQGYSADGGYSVMPQDHDMPSDALNQVADDCEIESGHRWIGVLRGAERMNPANRDVYEIMAECLMETKVVAPGYTAGEYRSDSESGLVPFLDPDTGPARLLDCNDDPLMLGLRE